LVEDESVLQRLYCGETYLCGFQKEKEICSMRVTDASIQGQNRQIDGCITAVGKLDFKKLRASL
jgi:hypothetical protein